MQTIMAARDHDYDLLTPCSPSEHHHHQHTTPTYPQARDDGNVVSVASHNTANTSDHTDPPSPSLPAQALARPTKRVRLTEPSSSSSSSSAADQHHSQHSIASSSTSSLRSHSPSHRHSLYHKSPHMTSSSTASVSNGNGHSVHEATTSTSKGHSSRTPSSNGTTAVTTATPETADYVGFRPIHQGSRIDRKELVRLTFQTLKDLGYESSARALESEAAITVEHPSIGAFREAVLNGDWRNAERLLIDGLNYAVAKNVPVGSSSRTPSTSRAKLEYDSVLRDPVNQPIESIRFLIHQQRYLELLEAGHVPKALSILRDRLSPLHHGTDRLHQLSSLAMCDSPQELRRRANWAGTGVESRRKLLHDIESSISPSVMLPSRRLPLLLEQAQTLQQQLDPFFNLPIDSHVSLYIDYQSDRSIFPTRTTHVLRGHSDEVWVMAFSHDGQYLATGGRDHKVIIWRISPDACDKVAVTHDGQFEDAITCLAWSPDDKALLVGSDDNLGYLTFEHETFGPYVEDQVHDYPIYTAAWLPDGTGYVTGSMDGSIRLFSVPLGESLKSHQVTHIWRISPFRVTSLDVSPDGKFLVVASWQPEDTTGLRLSTPHGNDAGNTASRPQRASSTTSSSQNSYTSESASPMSPAGQTSESTTLSARSVAETATTTAANANTDSLENGGLPRYTLSFYDIAKRREVGAVPLGAEVTSVNISRDSRFALINHRPGELQVWDIRQRTLVSKFAGHRLSRDMIRSCFGGSAQSFVASGSEDSSIYIWHRTTGKLLERLIGHGSGTVNAVAWHPRLPSLLASCSDDHTVRIWQPSQEEKQAPHSDDLGFAEEETTGRAAANGLNIQTPFPWSMSPARTASPETDGGQVSLIPITVLRGHRIGNLAEDDDSSE